MYGHGACNARAQAMNRFGRIICLLAWAAVIAAWALPPKPAPAVMPNPNADASATDHAGKHGSAGYKPSSSSAKLYAAGALPLAMEPADLWAIANLKFTELPPAEFDHATKDAVEIIDMPTEKELREVCHLTEAYRGANVVGCAAPKGQLAFDRCIIYLGPRPAWAGLTRNIVIRHETGHCNGWPGDHPGMR
jgi:hypothetical protein